MLAVATRSNLSELSQGCQLIQALGACKDVWVFVLVPSCCTPAVPLLVLDEILSRSEYFVTLVTGIDSSVTKLRWLLLLSCSCAVLQQQHLCECKYGS